MAGSIEELAKYRYERGMEELQNAKEVMGSGSYKLALNRSYYAIFHAMRAVNVLDEFDSSKHSGVIAHFNQYHVKTGDFDKRASKIIQNAMEMREHADVVKAKGNSLSLDDMKALILPITTEYPITKITLFGSRANGTNKEYSGCFTIVILAIIRWIRPHLFQMKRSDRNFLLLLKAQNGMNGLLLNRSLTIC